MIETIPLMVKRLSVSKRHSGASEGVTKFKLLRNGLPYFLSRQGYANYPLTIFLTVNGRCNLRCRMCDIGQKNDASMFNQNLKGENAQDFPIKRLKSLIDEVAFFKPYLSASTTEPLLYAPLFEAIRHARSRDLIMNVTTSGVLIGRRAEEILDSGLHRLSVSIDGPRDIHDEMRGVPGGYDKIMKGVKTIIEEKKRRNLTLPHIYISSFICDTNYAHLIRHVENLPLDGIERVNIKHMVYVSKEMVEHHVKQFKDKHKVTVASLPDDFSPDHLNINVLNEQVQEVKRRFGDKVAFHFKEDKEAMVKYYFRPLEFMDSSRCVFPWFVAQITNDGDLIPQTRCYANRYGNIMDRPFLDVWNGPEFRAFRRDLQKNGRFPACARCEGVLYR